MATVAGQPETAVPVVVDCPAAGPVSAAAAVAKGGCDPPART